MSTEKFDLSQLTEPDEFGFFTHPDIPGNEEDEGADWRAKLGAMGFQASTIDFESDADEADVDLWFNSYEQGLSIAEMREIITDWQPTQPPGDGWLLVSKFDTDSGPFALFVKPIQSPKGGG